MVPTAAGALVLGALLVCALTVTAMLWVAVALLGSVAVTVIVALPAATGVMVTVEPDTPTVALALSEELAV